MFRKKLPKPFHQFAGCYTKLSDLLFTALNLISKCIDHQDDKLLYCLHRTIAHFPVFKVLRNGYLHHFMYCFLENPNIQWDHSVMTACTYMIFINLFPTVVRNLITSVLRLLICIKWIGFIDDLLKGDFLPSLLCHSLFNVHVKRTTELAELHYF